MLSVCVQKTIIIRCDTFKLFANPSLGKSLHEQNQSSAPLHSHRSVTHSWEHVNHHEVACSMIR